MNIEEMKITDYEDVFVLWKSVEGMGLHDDADSQEGIAGYLERNPGLSFVARDNGKLIGAVLCGHDGRRGYLNHLAVAKTHRKKGTGKALVQQVLCGLRSLGITRCHIFIFAENFTGQEFWRRIGWTERADVKIMSKEIERHN